MADSIFMALVHALIWLGYLWPLAPLALTAWRRPRTNERALTFWVLGFLACHGVAFWTRRLLSPSEVGLDYSGPASYIAWRHVGLGFLGIGIPLIVSIPLVTYWRRMLNKEYVGLHDGPVSS